MSAPAPGWLRALADRADAFPAVFPQAVAPPEDGRRSAVLILFGPVAAEVAPAREGAGAVDVLLTERSHGLRSHPGQVAFPGGAIDPDDDGAVGAALREAHEETGLDPAGVEVLARLPEIFLAPSAYVVTPILAWWAEPSPVRPVDAREVARVSRVPVEDLLEPANRFRVRHPSGYIGPGFFVDGLFVWGFTAGLLDRVLVEAGLDKPWDTTRFERLPEHLVRR